jgi:hypothetical protein
VKHGGELKRRSVLRLFRLRQGRLFGNSMVGIRTVWFLFASALV